MQRPRHAIYKFCLAALLVCALGSAGHAENEQQRGKTLLESLCSRCHAVGKTGRSPNSLAPPFRTFSDDKLYDNDFSKRLQDGLSSIHPAMPTFHFSREDADAAVNYLRSIQEHARPKGRP